MLETKTETINGRTYVAQKLAAGAGGLATYRVVMGKLAPAVAAVLETAMPSLVASGSLKESASSAELLGALADAGALRLLGEHVGELLQDEKFTAAIDKLMQAGVSVDGKDLGTASALEQHFGEHLHDYLPVVLLVLRVNYGAVFFGALGVPLTSPQAGETSAKG